MRNRMRKTGWHAAAAALAAILAVPASAVVTIQVSTSNGAPGGTVILGLSLRRDPGDRSVATAQTDVIVDTDQMKLVGTCAASGQSCSAAGDCNDTDSCTLPCEKEPRLTQHSFSATLPPFQNLPPGAQRFRLAVVDTQFPIDVLTDGALASCVLRVPAAAAFGPLIVTADRLNVGDEHGNVVPAETEIDSGNIAPATPTPTPTSTSPATVTFTPGVPTATPTQQGTVTPTGGTLTPTPDTAPCPAKRASPAGPAVYVQDQTLPAATASGQIVVQLATGGSQVAGTQNDLELPSTIHVNAHANGRPDCTVEPSINKNGTSFAFRPTGCNPAAGECSVRALVLSTEDTNAISDGSVLYRCNIDVTGRGGEVAVTGVILSTPDGVRVPGAVGRSGVICVEAPSATPTITPTHVGPTATLSPIASSTPTTQATATRTRTNGPSGTATPNVSTGGGGGSGCNCAITPGQSPQGLSSMWLVLPALLLRWRRWRR